MFFGLCPAQVLVGLAAAAGPSMSAAALRAGVQPATVIGLMRDLRGIASATNSKRTYSARACMPPVQPAWPSRMYPCAVRLARLHARPVIHSWSGCMPPAACAACMKQLLTACSVATYLQKTNASCCCILLPAVWLSSVNHLEGVRVALQQRSAPGTGMHGMCMQHENKQRLRTGLLFH